MRLMLPTELELSKLRLHYQHIIEFVFLADRLCVIPKSVVRIGTASSEAELLAECVGFPGRAFANCLPKIKALACRTRTLFRAVYNKYVIL